MNLSLILIKLSPIINARVDKKRGRKTLIIAPWQLHVTLHMVIE
jgi:hypothetical protein